MTARRAIGDPRRDLVGIGLYTPAEAGRLLRINPHKISRWLRGCAIRGTLFTKIAHGVKAHAVSEAATLRANTALAKFIQDGRHGQR